MQLSEPSESWFDRFMFERAHDRWLDPDVPRWGDRRIDDDDDYYEEDYDD